MNAEIIAAGSELLSYDRLETNSLWLTARLNELGVEVPQKTVVNDDRARLACAVRQALERSEIVILSGGLGPTQDDLTREAVADALGRPLVQSEALVRWLEARFARMKRKMAATNLRQTFLVEGAEVIPNPNGSAVGQWIDSNGRIVMMLPGPPRELMPMVENHVLPRLKTMLPAAHICTRWLRVAGLGESDLDQLIAPVYRAYSNPVTTILAKTGDIEIHLRARCSTADEAQRLVDEVAAKIEPLLGPAVYSRDGEPLEKVLGRLLVERGATVSVAESMTGGLLGARITDVPGSSAYFLGGAIEPQAEVGEAAACAMASAVRERMRSTYALSITGDAGAVWIGLATPHKVEAKQFRFPGDRARVRDWAVQMALNLLRLEMHGSTIASPGRN